LAEPWLGKDQAVGEAVLSMTEDAALPVRFQLALSLGEWDDSRVGSALGRLAVSNPADSWMRIAGLSSATRQPAAILNEVLAATGAGSLRASLVEPLVATIVVNRKPEEMARALAVLTKSHEPGEIGWKLSAVAVLLDRSEKIPEALGPLFETARTLAR